MAIIIRCTLTAVIISVRYIRIGHASYSRPCPHTSIRHRLITFVVRIYELHEEITRSAAIEVCDGSCNTYLVLIYYRVLKRVRFVASEQQVFDNMMRKRHVITPRVPIQLYQKYPSILTPAESVFETVFGRSRGEVIFYCGVKRQF